MTQFQDLDDIVAPVSGDDGRPWVYDHGTGTWGSSDTVPNALALGGVAAAGYALAGHDHAGVYLPLAGTAANSQLLDGIDSTGFALSGHSHSIALNDLSDVDTSGADSGEALIWNGTAWVPGSAGVTDHGGLTGLSDDDHSAVYVALAPSTTTRNVVQPTNYANPALIVRAAANATNQYSTMLQTQTPAGSQGWLVQHYSTGQWVEVTQLGFKWTTSGASADMTFGPGGAAAITYGTNLAAATLMTVVALQVGQKPLVIRGAPSQTNNLQEWQNSAGTALARVNNLGQVLGIEGSAGSAVTFAQSARTTTGFNIDSSAVLSVVYGGTIRQSWNATGLGFFTATPVARQAHIPDPSGGGTQDAEARTAINAVLLALETYGLLATS